MTLIAATRNRALVALGVALLISVPGAATADDAAPGNVVEAAVQLGLDGKARYEAREHAEALSKFSAADRLAHSPVFTLYMARCLRALDRLLEAEQTYHATAEESLPETAPPPWLSAVAEAKAELDELGREIPRLTVHVDGADPGAVRLRLRGKPLVDGAEALRVDPGPATLVAQSGARQVEKTFELRRGEHQRIHLSFDDTLPTTSRPGPKPVPPPLPPPPPPADRSSHSAWTWTSFGIGAAALVVGGVTGSIAWTRSGELPCDRGSCEENSEGEVDDVRRYADIATVSFVLAGVAGATGLVLALTDEDDEQSASLHVTPGSVVIIGSF